MKLRTTDGAKVGDDDDEDEGGKVSAKSVLLLKSFRPFDGAASFWGYK